MSMFEIFIFHVITKYGSPCLPYLGNIKMLQSLYEYDSKNKFNQRQSTHMEVFCEKGIFKDLAKFTENDLCQSVFLRKS